MDSHGFSIPATLSCASRSSGMIEMVVMESSLSDQWKPGEAVKTALWDEPNDPKNRCPVIASALEI